MFVIKKFLNVLSQHAEIPASKKVFFKFLAEERKIPKETLNIMIAEKVCLPDAC